MSTLRVGFAGLGHMGLPMATRLAAQDIPLTVWNRTAPLATPTPTSPASPASCAPPVNRYRRAR
jgi:3-hydroxyisobutyrate dehydrogenase